MSKGVAEQSPSSTPAADQQVPDDSQANHACNATEHTSATNVASVAATASPGDTSAVEQRSKGSATSVPVARPLSILALPSAAQTAGNGKASIDSHASAAICLNDAASQQSPQLSPEAISSTINSTSVTFAAEAKDCPPVNSPQPLPKRANPGAASSQQQQQPQQQMQTKSRSKTGSTILGSFRNIRYGSDASAAPSGRSVPILEQALRARHPIYKLGTLANDTFEAGRHQDAFELYSWALLFLYPRLGFSAGDFLADASTRKRLKRLGWRLEKRDWQYLSRYSAATSAISNGVGPEEPWPQQQQQSYTPDPDTGISRSVAKDHAQQAALPIHPNQTANSEGSGTGPTVVANSESRTGSEMTPSPSRYKYDKDKGDYSESISDPGSALCNPLLSLFRSKGKGFGKKLDQRDTETMEYHGHHQPLLHRRSKSLELLTNEAGPRDLPDLTSPGKRSAARSTEDMVKDPLAPSPRTAPGASRLRFWEYLNENSKKRRVADPIALGGEDPIGKAKGMAGLGDGLSPSSRPISPLPASIASQDNRSYTSLRPSISGAISPPMANLGDRVFPADIDYQQVASARGPDGYCTSMAKVAEGTARAPYQGGGDGGRESAEAQDHDPWAMPNVEEKEEVTALLYANRSATAYALERYGEAVRDANRCIELRPRWAKGYFRKAEALLALGKSHEAYLFYKKAIMRDPNDTTIKLGYERARLTTKNEAMGLRVIQLLPGRDICHKVPGLHFIRNKIYQFATSMQNYIYIIVDIDTKICIIVDACWDVPGILRVIEREGLKLAGAMITHAHFDHIGGIPPPPFSSLHIRVSGIATLKKQFPYLPIMIHPLDIPALLEANPTLSRNQITATPNGFEFVLGKRTRI
ncbi:hypothetical protein EV182_001606, partial [Spiromyces aspiralis]